MGLFKMPEPIHLDLCPLVKTRLGGVLQMPISSKLAASFLKRHPMGLLALPMGIAGALVTLVGQDYSLYGQTVLDPQGSLFVIDSMSIRLLALENKGERLKNWLGCLGWDKHIDVQLRLRRRRHPCQRDSGNAESHPFLPRPSFFHSAHAVRALRGRLLFSNSAKHGAPLRLASSNAFARLPFARK